MADRALAPCRAMSAASLVLVAMAGAHAVLAPPVSVAQVDRETQVAPATPARAREPEHRARRPFRGPQLRLGGHVALEAIVGSTLGAIATLDLMVGARVSPELSLVLHVTAPDAGAWQRDGSGDAIAGMSVVAGLELMQLDSPRSSNGVAWDIGVGLWLLDERERDRGTGALPYVSMRLMLLTLVGEDPRNPIGSPQTGITAGLAVDPDTGAVLGRIGLAVIGFTMSGFGPGPVQPPPGTVRRGQEIVLEDEDGEPEEDDAR